MLDLHSPNERWIITPLVALGSLLLLTLSLNQLATFQNNVSQGRRLGQQISREGQPEHSISMSAEGKVTAVPDVALLDFSVQTQAKTVREAQEQNSQKMNAAIAYLKGLGIDQKDIKTTQYSLNPRYEWNPKDGSQKLVGYDLYNAVQVKVRDLDKSGEALDGVTASGVNQIGQIRFDIDNPEVLQAQARDQALVKARQKAEALARAAGVSLGKVTGFSESISGGPMPPPYYARGGVAMMEAAPAPQVEAGSQEVVVSVSVTFEIL